MNMLSGPRISNPQHGGAQGRCPNQSKGQNGCRICSVRRIRSDAGLDSDGAHCAHRRCGLKTRGPLNTYALSILLLTAWLLLPTLALGADKNGVSPNAISVPSGPGSVEGLGESFEPSLNSGT